MTASALRGYVIRLPQGGYLSIYGTPGPLRDARVWAHWVDAYDVARSRPGAVYSVGLAAQEEARGKA